MILKMFMFVITRGDYFLSDLIFIKKSIQNQFFFKKPKPVQTDRFWLFWEKNRFKPVWLGFFPVWVQFDFFDFRLIKPKPNRTSQFFQNSNRFNRFFSRFSFFGYFFRFNRFFDFFAHP